MKPYPIQLEISGANLVLAQPHPLLSHSELVTKSSYKTRR